MTDRVVALAPAEGRAVNFDVLAADLARLAASDRLRRLMAHAGADFSSNDYLGLSRSAELGQAVLDAIAGGCAVGSGGSRLLRGNHPEHEALEAEAAAYFGSEAALFFATGYTANAALLASVPQRGDLIIHDELIHASAHEGIRLSRAGKAAAGHNDVSQIDQAIARWRIGGGTGRPWIVVESLYSMDGDRAPLDDLVDVADRHDAALVIDEAHATGVFGAGGRGLAAGLDGRPNIITVRTCGKALGCEGALVCGPRIVRDFLINRGRGFIFSTAPSPLMAAAVRASLRLLADQPERRHQLAALIDHAAAALAPLGIRSTGSQIIPIVVGADARAMALAASLQARGFDIRGIRPPTVPAGTARLRLSITLNVDTDTIDALGDALKSVL